MPDCRTDLVVTVFELQYISGRGIDVIFILRETGKKLDFILNHSVVVVELRADELRLAPADARVLQRNILRSLTAYIL